MESPSQSNSTQEEAWKKSFIFIEAENKFKCNLCEKSPYFGLSSSNRKRHFKTKHPAIAEELGMLVVKRKNLSPETTDGSTLGSKKKKQKKVTKGDYIRDCVGLVAVNLLPLMVLDSFYFRHLSGSSAANAGLTLNSKNIKYYLQVIFFLFFR